LREGRVALVGQNCFIVGGMRDGNRGHWQLEVRRHQRHGLEGRLPALVEVTGLEVIGSERGWHGWLGFLGTNDPGSTRSSPTGHHGTGGSSAVGRVAPPDVDWASGNRVACGAASNHPHGRGPHSAHRWCWSGRL